MVLQLKKVVGCNSSQLQSDMSTLRIKEEEDTVPSDTYDNNQRRNLQRNNDQGRYPESLAYDGYNNSGKLKKLRGRNPLDSYGNVTRCHTCDLVNHYENECPDREKDL